MSSQISPMASLTLTLTLSLFFFFFFPFTLSLSSLDPKQLTALQSMGLYTSTDPCSSSHSDLTLCDSSSPFRHLIALSFTNCSDDLDISSTALRSLSTLRSLSFTNCPNLPQFKHPLPPALLSFSSHSSLKRLTGVWLSHLKNLTSLDLVSVPVSASAPFVFLSQMPRLTSAIVSDCNLTGQIPHHWHSLNLTHLDLSSNMLRGKIPSTINVLGSLESLNLSSNALNGTIPDTIGDLIFIKNLSLSRNSMSGAIPDSIKEMTELEHLDLSSNQFNGSLPRFLEGMGRLRFLNLGDNGFQGVLPYNASFVKRLQVFRVEGNGNLCYNKSLISSKMKLGIAPCDKYGLPVTPPPNKSTTKSDGYDDGSGDGDDDDDSEETGKSNGGGHHGGPNKLVLGVAIGLSCLVFIVMFLVCVSKGCCSS